VVRRTHVCALRSHAAHHEAFDGGADSFSAVGFLMCVEDGARFNRPDRIAVTLGRLVRSFDVEESRDVRHEHRKGVQQRIDPAIERRRGS
jgi:hypothetical protein